MVPFESLSMVSYSHSIVTLAISCIVSEIKRDIGRKSRFVHMPCTFNAPLKGTAWEFRHDILTQENYSGGIPEGEKVWRRVSYFHTIHERDRQIHWLTERDRQTHRQTEHAPWCRPRLYITLRGKNQVKQLSKQHFNTSPVTGCFSFMHQQLNCNVSHCSFMNMWQRDNTHSSNQITRK